eukprot:CAMPEP_0194226650 /NCGR_PEP_ID=MMETSP0156-20130528/42299_1 /TAXON_ID=33649 /ORGANISM="Thalassionema nitzschioides, Strain L26-B" /LENGTH=64 /DNA_ID=CAMNT_0038959079 /DNA_START=169 /DNA_END=360 /DNA_ORIENTATION=-
MSTIAPQKGTCGYDPEVRWWFVDFTAHFEKHDAGFYSIVDTGVASVTSMSEVLGLDDRIMKDAW